MHSVLVMIIGVTVLFVIIGASALAASYVIERLSFELEKRHISSSILVLPALWWLVVTFIVGVSAAAWTARTLGV